MSNLLKKKNEDEKSMSTTLQIFQKKIEKLQKQNDEVSEMYCSSLNSRNPLKCICPMFTTY